MEKEGGGSGGRGEKKEEKTAGNIINKKNGEGEKNKAFKGERRYHSLFLSV